MEVSCPRVPALPAGSGATGAILRRLDGPCEDGTTQHAVSLREQVTALRTPHGCLLSGNGVRSTGQLRAEMRGEVSADGSEAQEETEAAAQGGEAAYGRGIDGGGRVPALALSRPRQPEAAGLRGRPQAGAAGGGGRRP